MRPSIVPKLSSNRARGIAALLVALAAVTVVSGAEGAPAVVLRSGAIAGATDVAGLPEHLRAAPDALSREGLAVVRFLAPAGAPERDALAARGARTVAPLSAESFLVQLPGRGSAALAGIPGVAWVAPYHPGLRIAPEIARLERGDARVVPTTVHLVPDADVPALAARLRAYGLVIRGTSDGERTDRGARPGRIVIAPPAGVLAELRDAIARWSEVVWIGRRPSYRLLNDASAWVGQSGLDRNGATPVYDHGIFGEGQTVAVLDTGLDADMCYFRDDALGLPPTNTGFEVGTPDPNQRKVTIVNFLWDLEDPSDPTDWDTQDHGTHVAGSVLGDEPTTPGRRDPGDGMAPAAKLVMQDGGYAVDDCADMPAIGCPAASLTPFFQQAYDQGARIHSNSYGDRENFTPYNIYSDGSEDADAFMWANPDFLLVFAAGNNGPGLDTVASPATAKNVLSVGATSHGAAAGTLASFSSRGNTHDGRWKPDVTIPGSSVISADNDGNVGTDNCSTRSMSGTSMACPTAAGLAALAREYYEKGFYPSGSAEASDGLVPSAALLKATLVASAKPMEGLSTPPPEPNQGWGRILLDDALFFPEDGKRLFVHDVPDRFDAPSNAPDSFALEVLDGSEPLRVALAWTDYPSTPAASVNLVNDLDLELTSPSGAVYFGNVFASGVSVTGGAADRRNNVEVARIEDPEPGTWTVRVAPFAVPQPAQGYALVVTGRMPASGVFLERRALGLDDTVGGDGDGVLEPGEWVDLPLTLANTGDTAATGVRAIVESLSPYVEVVASETTFADLATGAEASDLAPHVRVRMTLDLPCTDAVTLRFRYLADGYERVEESTLPTGTESVFRVDDFESPNGWTHVAAESTATTGAWTVGDPDGTDHQPEDDATAAPGVSCLFTAPNPGGVGTDDVDDGVVVARSGAYDLSGRPEARLRVARWFANRDLGEDAGDFWQLHIREAPGSPDVLLEEIGTDASAQAWTRVDFRVADFVVPGPTVELRVAASDGPATGNIIEGALDDIVFWEPACDRWDPAPNAVRTLRAARESADVRLTWDRPALDPSHGATETYDIYRSSSPDTGFERVDGSDDPSETVSWVDVGAAGSAGPFYYSVVASNAAGDSEPVP